jgi:hypothetical protein
MRRRVVKLPLGLCGCPTPQILICCAKPCSRHANPARRAQRRAIGVIRPPLAAIAQTRSLRPPHKGPTFVVGTQFGARCGGPNIFPDNSRFGRFNSRLGDANSRLGLLPEFARKELSWPSFFAAKPRLCGKNRRNSRFNGKARNLIRSRDGVPKAAAHWAHSSQDATICPEGAATRATVVVG